MVGIDNREEVTEESQKLSILYEQLLKSLESFLQNRLQRIVPGKVRGRVLLQHFRLLEPNDYIAAFVVVFVPNIGESEEIRIDLAEFCLVSGKYILYNVSDRMYPEGEDYIAKLRKKLAYTLEDFGCRYIDHLENIFLQD